MHKYKYTNAQILDLKYQTTVLPPPGKTPVALPDLRNYKRDIQGKTKGGETEYERYWFNTP